MPYDGLRPVELLEPGDWPDDPSLLGAAVDADLVQVMDSVRLVGRLDPFGTITSAGAPAFQDTCPGITTGVVGAYNGDVDFVRLHHPGGGLCLYLREPFSGPEEERPRWDLVVYEYVDGCATGPFLSRASNDGSNQPIPVVQGSGTNALAESPEIVVYVAGVLGYPSVPVEYTVDVVSTSFDKRCPVLQDGDFGDPR